MSFSDARQHHAPRQQSWRSSASFPVSILGLVLGRAFLLIAPVLWGTHCRAADRVFTIFAEGTGGHRSGQDLELVTEFGAAYWDRKSEDDGLALPVNLFYRANYQKTFLILDGVGTCDMKDPNKKLIGNATESRPRHPTPGDFEYASLDKRIKPAASRVSNMKTVVPGKNRGDIYGDGWDDNVAHALLVLNSLGDKEFPTVINMVGWSRGAVTCIKLATAIDSYFVQGKDFYGPKDYKKGYRKDNLQVLLANSASVAKKKAAKKLKINLFLIDPVPGRFGASGVSFDSKRSTEKFPPDEKDYRSLPKIVQHCLITLANDEQREGFAPLDADDIRTSSSTKIVWLPFPGIHRTQVRLRPRDPGGDSTADEAEREKLKAVPRLVWDLAHRFLVNHGTVFRRPVHPVQGTQVKPLRSAKIVDLYSDVWLNKKRYHEVRNRGQARLAGGLMPRLYTGYPFAGREYSGKNPLQGKRERKDLVTGAFGVYVKHPGFFINEHHRACFQRAYPKTYAYLTSGGRKTKAQIKVGKNSVSFHVLPAAELAELKGSTEIVGSSLSLYEQLASLGMFRDADHYRDFQKRVTAEKAIPINSTFTFGPQLGEPLRVNRKGRQEKAEKARFTGGLEGMKVLGAHS